MKTLRRIAPDDNTTHIRENQSPKRVYRVETFIRGICAVRAASSKMGEAAMIFPVGSTNPLMPVLADLARARLFSTALNTAMEKC